MIAAVAVSTPAGSVHASIAAIGRTHSSSVGRWLLFWAQRRGLRIRQLMTADHCLEGFLDHAILFYVSLITYFSAHYGPPLGDTG